MAKRKFVHRQNGKVEGLGILAFASLSAALLA
jgi:hypothetical protein